MKSIAENSKSKSRAKNRGMMRLFFYRKIKQESGVALLLILSLSMIIIPLLQNLWSDSRLDYKFRRHSMNQTQARWNAKSGLDMALLRLYLFKAVEKSLPTELQTPFRPLLDQSWQVPFAWPFSLFEDLLDSEKEIINDLTQESLFKGSYYTILQAEDALLDINDLSSSLPYLKDFTYNTLFNLLVSLVAQDESLKEKYSEGDLAEILNHIADWTDFDNISQGGGAESLIEEGSLPLNRSFVSLEELKKVPKLESDLFDLIKPYITVHGAKSLNINYAKPEILEALDLPYDVVHSLALRTQRASAYYQPFSSQKDFCEFMRDQAYDFCNQLDENYQTLDMLRFSTPIAFRIQSKGAYRSQIAEWEAVVYDLSALATLYQKKRNAEIKRQENLDAGIENQPSKPKESGKSDGKLKFDYSYHRSLAIMYLKK